MFTSKELSQKLADNGCELESDYVYVYTDTSILQDRPKMEWVILKHKPFNTGLEKAYDILNDICVKYAKEFFGEKLEKCEECGCTETIEYGEYDCWGWYCKGCNRTVRNPYESMDVLNWGWEWHSNKIFELIQQNKIKEAEDYLWNNCKFNPLNK